MINRYMRLLVMFDLPTTTEKERKIYTNFRKFLLKDGYFMLQYSVYSRICKNSDDIKKHEAKLRANIPSKGNIRLIQITEKQFEKMIILCGNSKNEETISVEPLITFE